VLKEAHAGATINGFDPAARPGGRAAVAVSAAFVCLGIALRVPWYATAFFAVCLVAGLLLMLGVWVPDPAPTDHLTIDDVGITRTARNLREHVAWGDIARVRIMTTDEGPWLEDVFFVIDAKNGNGCVVAQISPFAAVCWRLFSPV
jgi:hypothetical protein